MENSIDYQEAIKQELQYIPQAYLASLYQIIALMAQPFKHGEEEDSDDKKKVTQELLQDYVSEARMGFGFYFKEDNRLNASYHIGENLTYICFSVIDIEMFEEEIKHLETSMEALLEEKEVSTKILEQKLAEKQKAVLYDKNNFYIVKKTQKELWQNECAKEDIREEIAKVLAKLPNYSEDEI